MSSWPHLKNFPIYQSTMAWKSKTEILFSSQQTVHIFTMPGVVIELQVLQPMMSMLSVLPMYTTPICPQYVCIHLSIACSNDCRETKTTWRKPIQSWGECTHSIHTAPQSESNSTYPSCVLYHQDEQRQHIQATISIFKSSLQAVP